MSHYLLYVFGEDADEQIAHYEEARYNYQSKWDWYLVGGRWENCLKLKDNTSVNIAKKCDIDFDNTELPYAFVIDGKWYEKGKMRWWGQTIKQKSTDEQWKKKFFRALKKLPDDIEVTAIDCHI